MDKKSANRAISFNWQKIKSNFFKLLNWVKWPMVVLVAAYLLSPDFWAYWGQQNVNAQLILEYIAVLRWPLIALLALILLKPHIPNLVSRVKKGKAFGLEAEFTDQTSVSVEAEEEIKKQPGSDQTAQEEPDEKGLEKLLTSKEAKDAFGEVYESIFGSQILILKRLASHIPDGLTKEKLTDIYQEAHVQPYESSYPSFLAYIQFLLDNSLVLHDEEDGRYKLTNAGVYFLAYLREEGLYFRTKPY